MFVTPGPRPKMMALRASARMGKFVCAKDDGSVLPLMLVHFNIVM